MRKIAGILGIVLLFWLLPAFAADGMQTNRALLIGVDLFVSQASTYPSSANNVQDMYKVLQQSAIPFQEVLIPDQPAIGVQQLHDWIGQTFAAADADDYNYLYMSTHGDFDEDGNAVLLLSDGKTEDRLTAAQLEAMFDGIQGTNIVILDACYSGAFIGKGMPQQPENVNFRSPRFKVLTSSGAMEESWYWNGRTDDAQGSYYFTQILTQGLGSLWAYPADRNRDGSITLTELRRYMLENHGASTPQAYPEEDDTVLFAYDPDISASGERSAVVDVVFSGDTIRPGDSLSLSFTALRPVRIAYQVVYRRDGRWQFGEAELMYDEAERFTAFGDLAGAILPGRKSRTITLAADGEDLYGYVLVQLLSLEGGSLTMQTGHVLTVLPAAGELALSVTVPAAFAAVEGAELPIFVAHALPCELSVTVKDAQGRTVKRLAYRRPSRPLGMAPEGSCYYWDGRNTQGEAVPEGEYTVLVEGWIGNSGNSVQSESIIITR